MVARANCLIALRSEGLVGATTTEFEPSGERRALGWVCLRMAATTASSRVPYWPQPA